LKPSRHKENEMARSQFPILRFFEYEHLPPKLLKISTPFWALAHTVADNAPCGTTIFETEMALRKLLEAKDCAVRAQIIGE